MKNKTKEKTNIDEKVLIESLNEAGIKYSYSEDSIVIKAENVSFKKIQENRIPIKNKRVVVTGIGLISPSGYEDDLWGDCICGNSRIDFIKHHKQKFESIKYGGEIRSNIDNYLPKKINSFFPRSAKLAAISLERCIQNSGFDNKTIAGLIYGSASMGADNIQKISNDLTSGAIENFDPRKLLMITPAGIVQYLANYFRIKGRVIAINRASASGLSTITEAFYSIQNTVVR